MSKLSSDSDMTQNLITSVTGSVLAAAQVVSTELLPAQSLDSVGKLGALALLIWMLLLQTRECDKLREKLREEIKKCSHCRLARAANENLIEQAREHGEHETENQTYTGKDRGGR